MNKSNLSRLIHPKPQNLAPHLLFAHRNDELRGGLSSQLRQERYRVEEISGDLAAALDQYTPHLIVADAGLVGEPEIERLKRLKKIGRPVPLVIMTSQAGVPAMTHRLGMVFVFKTPFETCDFLTAVGFLLDCTRASRTTVSNQAISQVS